MKTPRIVVSTETNPNEWVPDSATLGPRELTTGIGCFRDGRYALPEKSGPRAKGVRVVIAEWDAAHKNVYLGINTRSPGYQDPGAFEGPIAAEQVDEIIAVLSLARDEARRLGILPPPQRSVSAVLS